MPDTVWVGIALSAATAITYAYVGRVIERRGGDGASAPLRAFALWWAGLALFTAIGVGRDTLGMLGLLDRDVLKTLSHLSIPPLVLGLWGLFYYLGYIFVGGKRLFWPSVSLYAAIYAVFIYIVVVLEPAEIVERAWHVQIDYTTTLAPWVNLLLLGLLIVPILAAVLAYASLFFRLERGEQRVRVGVVSFAFLIWFGGTLFAALIGLAELEWWGLAGRILALVSAGLVVLAYRPPQRLRAAWAHRPMEADERG